MLCPITMASWTAANPDLTVFYLAVWFVCLVRWKKLFHYKARKLYQLGRHADAGELCYWPTVSRPSSVAIFRETVFHGVLFFTISTGTYEKGHWICDSSVLNFILFFRSLNFLKFQAIQIKVIAKFSTPAHLCKLTLFHNRTYKMELTSTEPVNSLCICRKISCMCCCYYTINHFFFLWFGFSS